MSNNSQNVIDTPNKNTIFLVWNFKEENVNKKVFENLCKLVINLNNSARTRFPNAKASIVMGIGYDAWNNLDLPEPLPKEFKNFEEIKGEKHTAVSTKGDLHFHIRSDHFSFCVDAANEISMLLNKDAESILEIHGFRYWDGRSILGFVDGTENPQGDDRNLFGIIGDEDPDYKGCSYLFVQKYVHDMQSWNNLPIHGQEKVIGRSKVQDIEMSDEEKPSNSHSALANVGDDKKIVRDNMPFGTVSNNEMGTYFIAYASTFSTVQLMLNRMFVGVPEGNYDRILDYSTPKTGTLFFVPTFDMLSDFAG